MSVLYGDGCPCCMYMATAAHAVCIWRRLPVLYVYIGVCMYRHLYVYIYKLFQTCSIQIDLGTCLNRGYMIFAYIKLYNYNMV